MTNRNEFIVGLDEVALIRQARAEAIADWGDDIPGTLLFSKLGKAIASNFRSFSLNERTHIFKVVESGMSSAENDLKALVATGLLEAIASWCANDSDLERQINEALGDESRKYLLALNKWHLGN